MEQQDNVLPTNLTQKRAVEEIASPDTILSMEHWNDDPIPIPKIEQMPVCASLSKMSPSAVVESAKFNLFLGYFFFWTQLSCLFELPMREVPYLLVMVCDRCTLWKCRKVSIHPLSLELVLAPKIHPTFGRLSVIHTDEFRVQANLVWEVNQGSSLDIL